MTRHADAFFDPRIADWLEDDPTTAPRAVLDTVLAAVPSIDQRMPNRTWLPRYAAPTRIGVAAWLTLLTALLLALIIGAVTVGPPRPSPSPTPARAAHGLSGAVASYGSPVYGYTVERPVEWQVRSATTRLGELGAPWIDSEAIDYIAATRASVPPGIIIGGADLQPGRLLDEWTDDVVVATCGAPTTREETTIDGDPARVLTYARCNGYFHVWATVIHDGLGLHVVLITPGGTEREDRALLDSTLSSLRWGAAPSGSQAPAASPEPRAS